MLRRVSRPFITVVKALSVSGSFLCSALGVGMVANEVTLEFSISGVISMASRIYSRGDR
jgi:hypothetical protein